MRRTRLIFFSIVAVAASIILASRLMLTVRPADPEVASEVRVRVTPSADDLERGLAKLPDFRRSPAEEPVSAQVVDVIPIFSSIGSIYFVGEVVNTGSEPIAKPETIISLLDADGNRLLFETGYTFHDIVAPNESVPVIVLFTDPPPVWDSFEVFLQARKPTGREFMTYTSLSATDAEILPDEFGGYGIVGAVKNIGDARVEFVQAIISLSGDDGKIVGVGSAYVDQTKLEPGETSSFSIRVMNVVAPATSFRLYFVGHGK